MEQMPFVTCAACGCDTLILFGRDAAEPCRHCSAPLVGDQPEAPWVVRTEHEGFELVKVGGSLAGDTAAKVALEIDVTADRGTLLDLTYCTFIDAAGVELLVRASLAAGGNAGFFSVVGARGSVAQIIDFAEGGRAVPRFPDVGTALVEIESEPTLL